MLKKGLNKANQMSLQLFQKIFILLLITTPVLVSAQDVGGQVSPGSEFFVQNLQWIVIGLLVIILLVFLFGMMVFGDKLIKISARKLGNEKGYADEEDAEGHYSFFPKLFPDRANKSEASLKIHKIEKGFNIYIKGSADKVIEDYHAPTYALRPGDFKAMSPIPKLQFEVGDEIKAGDAIFFDKKRPEVFYSSPVSGEIIEIKRGEKRRIVEIVILADKETKYKEFKAIPIADIDRQTIVDTMLQNGTWPYIRQRPFSTVADPNDDPKMIYISCFDTAPLAPDYDFIIEGQGAEFQAGLDILKKLTNNDVHLGLNAQKMPNKAFTEAKGVQKHWFSGPHPAGNVGIQIHHVNPINKGETVWYLNPQDVVIIGRFFLTGKLDARKIIALTGPEIIAPKYYRTLAGASIKGLLENNLKTDHVRYISGNVLTGQQIDSSGHLGFYDNMFSVILEGDHLEFFGWLMPSYPRPTYNPSFLSYYYEGEEHRVNTNSHGEERAFVVTGLYERVLPMDIYPIPLFKAILAQDFEQMEGLGIYEISEEDVALCEFVCPSKIDLQQIVRDGLEIMRTQG